MTRSISSWGFGAIVIGIALAGCGLTSKPGGASTSGGGAEGRSGAGAIQYVNPFEPQRMRVHGLTAITTTGGEPRIDAHIELFDAHGHPVKALGSLVFQLYAGAAPDGDLGMQLRRWVVDLSDPATNASAYDRVTRTYRVALTGAPPAEAARGYILEAQFRSIGGHTISARHGL